MVAKPPTAKMIDDACREGLVVLYGDRRVTGAVAHRKMEITIKGYLWVNLQDDYSWHYVPAGEVVITDKVGRRRKKVMATGKRAPGSPSHLKLASKAAQKPAESKQEPKQIEPKDKGKKRGEASPIVVSRTGGKQGELPGVETSKRKIAEIEDLADIYDDKKAAKVRATEEFKDAEENLVVSMIKHDRTSYSRKTWGRVKVKESKRTVSFKREKTKGAE